MIYKINNYSIEVECAIDEYKSIVFDKFDMFEKSIKRDNKKHYNKLIINNNYTKIVINNKKKIINGKIEKTDLYPIIYNTVARLINDEKNVLIHSTVISKGDKGFLLLGNFGQGKSTLALYARKNDFEINSADQTWISIKKNKLIMEKGSKFLFYNDEKIMLDEKNITKKINIKSIVLLYGLCDNGTYSETVIDVKSHYIKNLYQYISWHTNIPLFTDKTFLDNSNQNSINMLMDMSKYIDLKIIRGSKENILKKIS